MSESDHDKDKEEHHKNKDKHHKNKDKDKHHKNKDKHHKNKDKHHKNKHHKNKDEDHEGKEKKEKENKEKENKDKDQKKIVETISGFFGLIITLYAIHLSYEWNDGFSWSGIFFSLIFSVPYIIAYMLSDHTPKSVSTTAPLQGSGYRKKKSFRRKK